MIFKYSQFREFIQFAKGIGNIIPICEFNNINAIILRQDVDFDIEAAYRLAMIEAEYDVRSTFFILTNCQTYNPFSVENRKKLREMTSKGFEIGLHFDPTAYGNINPLKLKNFVDQEAEMLSFITGGPITSVSLHNPSVHKTYPIFDGYNNAYDSKIFSDDNYLADSRMDFRGKNPYEFIKKVKVHPIQILLHPLHYSEDGMDYPDIFLKHISKYIDAIDKSFRLNSTYEEQISPVDLFSYVLKNGKK
ncbi:MAG: polysaccharide deacetylase family protein [Planctomycetota bacterium]|jgi:hypothetical protein